MSSVASALGPVFLLILFGSFLRYIKFPEDHFWPQVERLTYFVLMPAMLVFKLATADIGDTPLLPTLISIVGMLLLGTLVLFLFRNLFAKTGPAFTSVYQGGIRFNTYIGLACADALYGDAGLIIAAIVIAILIPIINVLCVSVFYLVVHKGELGPKSLLAMLIKNPLILGCVLGITLNQTGIGLPGWSENTLSLTSSAALPLGILAVGVALDVRAIRGGTREILSATLVRFLVMPLILLAVMSQLSIPHLNQQILVLFAVLPTATSAFILARQLGGDTVLMANITTIQTLLGFAFIPAWLTLAENIR